jgi:hypothetical protein
MRVAIKVSFELPQDQTREDAVIYVRGMLLVGYWYSRKSKLLSTISSDDLRAELIRKPKVKQ